MKTGIGIMGCSRRIKALLEKLLELDKTIEIKGMCDPDKQRIEEFKNELAPNAAVYKTEKEMLHRAEGIDWIAVGSWNSLHAQQALTALEMGKNVFCEKPVATNFEDCLALKKAYLESGKKLMTGFTLRYTWHYRKIKELIDENRIGRIISFEFNETLGFNHGGHIMCCWRRKREFTGSHILEKCCHDIDLANWIIGSRIKKVASFGGLDFFKPENGYHIDRLTPDEAGHKAYCSWPSARGNNPFTSDKDIIDNQVCIMEYENGARATFHTNLNAGIPERRMYILGTEGAIRADLAQGSIELQRIGFTETPEIFKGEHAGGHGGGDTVLVEYWSRMMHEEIPPLTDIKSGIESAIACMALDEAMQENRIIDLTEKWRKLDNEMCDSRASFQFIKA